MLKSSLPLLLAMLSADESKLLWLLGTLAALLAFGIGLVFWIRRYVDRCVQEKARKLAEEVHSAVIVAGPTKRRP